MGGSTLQTDLFEGPAPQYIDKRHRTILLDPPWPEKGGGKSKRGADRHYPTVPVPRMPKLITLDSGMWNPARDAHLWMWVTNNFLDDGLWLMRELGFRYVTNAVWVKVVNTIILPGLDVPFLDWIETIIKIGLGQYMRGCHELLLFGTRGDAMMPAKAKIPKSVIVARRGQHSRKPDKQYKLIEAVSPGPRIEFFARRTWSGWEHFGNELCPECSMPLEEICNSPGRVLSCAECGHQTMEAWG